MLSQIEQAVRERRFLKFTYNDCVRIVKPSCLGIGPSGKPLLRAYQIAGGSVSGHDPMWRLFDVTKICNLKLLNKTFRAPEFTFSPFDPAMTEIIARV